MQKIWTYSLLVFMLCTACSEAEDVYDRTHFVAFRYEHVATKHALRSALQGSDIFCMVTASGGRFCFTNNYGQTDYDNIEAVLGPNPFSWPCGLIVGHFAVPTLRGETEVAYALECSNCCEWDNIERPVEFTPATLKEHTENRVFCPRCKRVYDLSLEGIIVGGRKDPSDIKLRRYSISYDGNNVVNVFNQ